MHRFVLDQFLEHRHRRFAVDVMKLEETGVEHSFQHASEIGLNRGPCGMAAAVLQQVPAQVDEKAGAAVSLIYSEEQLLPWRFGCAL